MNFVANKSGQLSDMITLTSRATEAEGYLGEDMEIRDVALSIRTEEGIVVEDSYVLYQNEPNPFKQQTTISYYAPEAAKATLTIYDVTGKVVLLRDLEAEKGYNETRITRSELGSSGILYYQLESGEFTATKKMIVIE